MTTNGLTPDQDRRRPLRLGVAATTSSIRGPWPARQSASNRSQAASIRRAGESGR